MEGAGQQQHQEKGEEVARPYSAMHSCWELVSQPVASAVSQPALPAWLTPDG